MLDHTDLKSWLAWVDRAGGGLSAEPFIFHGVVLLRNNKNRERFLSVTDFLQASVASAEESMGNILIDCNRSGSRAYGLLLEPRTFCISCACWCFSLILSDLGWAMAQW